MAKRLPGNPNETKKRLKTSSAKEDDADTVSCPLVGGFTAAGFRLVEKWSNGNISATELQELAQAMVDTYGYAAEDVSSMAALGASGNSPAHCQRDLLNMKHFKKIHVPLPSSVEAYVLKQKGSVSTVEKELVYFFKPSDWVNSLKKAGLQDQILGSKHIVDYFWSNIKPNDPRLQGVKDFKKKLWWPMLLHGDAGPHAKHDSLDVYSIRSLVCPGSIGTYLSHLLLIGLPMACRVTESKCKNLGLPEVEDTLTTIGKEIAKDLNKLFLESKMVLWIITADCDHLAKDYGLPHFANKTRPCMRCMANFDDKPVTDVRPTAAWRTTLCSPASLKANPLTEHWLLTVRGVTHHSFVYDPMHVIEIGAASHAIANVLYDVFYKELKGTNAQKVHKLNEILQQCYDSAGVSDDMRIGWLDQRTFADAGAPHQNYPELMTSIVKARRTRYLVPAMMEMAKLYVKESDTYSMRRFFCLRSLSDAYNVVDRNPLFLNTAEFVQYKDNVQNFLSHYVFLAIQSAKCVDRVGQFQWSFTVKFHYMFHIADDAEFISPKAFWCYGGESMVGLMTRIAQSCLSGMPPHRVTEALCLKYRIGKHLQFSEMSG